jgi:rhodanese-related sulfurtransferase
VIRLRRASPYILRMSRRTTLIAALCAAVLLGGTGLLMAWAGETPALTADDAARRVAAHSLTLLDVRSSREWRQTGVPAGAKTVTIHDPAGLDGFVQAAKRAVDGDLDAPVALICRTGVRSTRAANALLRAGFKTVYNVREGVAGNAVDGPGWIARGLKTEKPPGP